LKYPISSRVALRRGEQELGWDLQGPKFLIGSATLPSVLDDEGDDAFLERTALIHELARQVDALYFAFLRERLAPLWKEAWEPAIVAWADGESVPTTALQALVKAARPPRGARARKLG